MTEEEFRNTVMCHRQMMMAIAMTVLCNREDALDCLQDTFVALWKNRDKIGDLDSVRQYCLTSVRNNAMMMIKKRRSASLESADELSVSDDPLSRIERNEKMRILEKGLRKLPESQRQVLLMSSISGLSAPEIAEMTSMSYANVRQLLSRGRQFLKVYFKMNGN